MKRAPAVLKVARLNLYVHPHEAAVVRRARHAALDEESTLNDLVFRALVDYLDRKHPAPRAPTAGPVPAAPHA